MLVDLVRVTTPDGYHLDGALQRPAGPCSAKVDAYVLLHGTGSNFYSSTLLEFLADRLLAQGYVVLRGNTRGHDGINTTATSKGGRRLGAAFEVVDECRHDVAAWVDFLRKEAGPRVGLLGHSLGAVKCLYAAVQQPNLKPSCIVAVSPPHLSYEWFCQSPQAPVFLDCYRRAEALAAAGQPQALLEVNFPLPMVISAAGYLEKYGPEERYNYLRFCRTLDAPTLFVFGGVEAANNAAFQQGPEGIRDLGKKRPHVAVDVVPGADHFYSGVRVGLWETIEKYLTKSVVG